MDNAWMLRNDGHHFPVKVHLYAMGDSDLSSEAECASFIVMTKSRDMSLAKYVLDCWMALLIENTAPLGATSDTINKCISEAITNLPYKFPYMLSVNDYIAIHNELDNYSDIDSLYDFIDNFEGRLSTIQSQIRWSINQQFCRVRYGGQYNSHFGSKDIWFRISSINYNWADCIYMFVSAKSRSTQIDTITICRDFESDNGEFGDSEYFYKAKDGAVYRNMPLEEFLNEEHEHSLVFDASKCSGLHHIFGLRLRHGLSLEEANSDLNLPIYSTTLLSHMVMDNQSQHCVLASEYLDSLSVRSWSKINRAKQRILHQFPEITGIELDTEPRLNSNGKPVGAYYNFKLQSNDPRIDDAVITVSYNRTDVSEDILFRNFRIEYLNWINHK